MGSVDRSQGHGGGTDRSPNRGGSDLPAVAGADNSGDPADRQASPAGEPTERKTPYLYAGIFGGVLGAVVINLGVFRAAVLGPADPVVVVLRAFVVVCLCVFWLFGAYNVVVTAFGYLGNSRPETVPYAAFADEPVAIIYPTYDDFSPDHLDRSREQTHEHTHTYVVDDSTDPEVIAAIDRYAAGDPDVTVVRREGREGYKAGAINHALRTRIDEPYFVLMDADEVLPEDFVASTFRYFTDDGVGFVQANHDYNRETATRFGRALGIGVDVHWDVYQPPRNAHGFVMLLGHGALVRRDVWAEIGGFPHLVSEDLAFATRAREHGYRGVFAADVDCLEDFPVDYRAFRRRHKKWTAGSIEFILDELPRYLRADEPSLVEKADVLVPTLQLPLTVLFVGYILAVGALRFAGATVLPTTVDVPAATLAITVVTLLSPLYCYVVGLWDRPLKLLHFLATSTTVYCSVAVLAVAHGAKVLLPWERARFLTTPKREADGVALRAYAPTVGFGLGTLAVAATGSILVGTAALSWLLAPVMENYNRDDRVGTLARTVSLVPMVILAGGIGYGLVVLGG